MSARGHHPAAQFCRLWPFLPPASFWSTQNQGDLLPGAADKTPLPTLPSIQARPNTSGTVHSRAPCLHQYGSRIMTPCLLLQDRYASRITWNNRHTLQFIRERGDVSTLYQQKGLAAIKGLSGEDGHADGLQGIRECYPLPPHKADAARIPISPAALVFRYTDTHKTHKNETCCKVDRCSVAASKLAFPLKALIASLPPTTENRKEQVAGMQSAVFPFGATARTPFQKYTHKVSPFLAHRNLQDTTAATRRYNPDLQREPGYVDAKPWKGTSLPNQRYQYHIVLSNVSADQPNHESKESERTRPP